MISTNLDDIWPTGLKSKESPNSSMIGGHFSGAADKTAARTRREAAVKAIRALAGESAG
jgi:hypothetical protein